MMAAATLSLTNYQLQSHPLLPQPLSKSNTLLSSQPPHPSSSFYLPTAKDVKKLDGRRKAVEGLSCRAAVRAAGGWRRPDVSPWDDKPYEILPTGKRAYLDEQDVVAFLDPPMELIPLDPASYNPAAYLWKKIDDVPEERRHRLIHLLDPRLISRAWEIAGTRYEDSKLTKLMASNLLSCKDGERSLEFYHCRSGGGPSPIGWMKFFKKAIFRSNSGKVYGRFIAGGVVGQIANSISPLYFLTTEDREVMATEQPCDLAYEFGDGHLNLDNCPVSFPKPGKHPYPFNDQVMVYVRHIGPGVSVGQAWQEGKELQQVPRKLCGEILMVKDYSAA
ncbi:unnamed protein product [Linum trigynum]|uniref:Uncharacterized protein n=1 Tax=Linum trigynum TaxID=586398 RepID=A0AAV2DJ60_9ROSI